MRALVVLGPVLDFTDAPGREPDWSAAAPLAGVTKITPDALAEIARLNRKWFYGGTNGRRADLRRADLAEKCPDWTPAQIARFDADFATMRAGAGK